MGKRYVFYDIESWSFLSNLVPRSDYTIWGPKMFCASMPTRRARARIAGTMETSIHSRSSCIPLQVLPLCDSMMTLFVSTIKVSDNITFGKHPQNNSLKIDQNTDFIRVINQRGSTQPWKEALPIAKAVKGSSFSIIRDPTNKLVSRIYYQDPELHLKELCYDHLGDTNQGVIGEHVPELCPSMNGHPSHFRWLQPRGAAAWNPNNCGSCPRW